MFMISRAEYENSSKRKTIPKNKNNKNKQNNENNVNMKILSGWENPVWINLWM